jgi:protein O-mannosyl-transferase
MKKLPGELRLHLAGAILFFGTLLLFSRALQNDFLDFDDPDYVTQNVHVQNGFSLENVRWAFTSTAAGNWHPLTWLSLMLDAQIYGDSARGFHSTNILFHALNATLAFLVLRKLTGAFWTSAICAALFAWHPLRVESVAWIAERKDVLSGFFFLLALLAYAHFAEKSKSTNPRAKFFYALVFLFFACGAMCKPMLVTLPFVLLLLDLWPLQRFDRASISRLLVEKIPFFVLSAAICAVTYFAQKKGGAIVETLPFDFRLENAVVSIAGYVGKFFWPFNLAVVYPLPNRWPISTVAVSISFALIFTIFAISQWRSRPYLPVGWFWFVGMLVPVVGFVQAGHQAMADRYTYLPILGLQVALLWWLRGLFLKAKIPGIITAALAIFVLAGCAARTWNQEAVWKNSATLYEHALAVTKNNYLAESNLGTTLFNEKHFAEAEKHFRRAIEINPGFATARFKLALTLDESGRADGALDAYEGLLKIRPLDADAHYDVGVILLNRGKPAEAIPHFQAAIESQNDYAAAFVGLGLAQMQTGKTADAVENFQRALKLNPDFPGVSETLAQLREKSGATNSVEK